MQPQLHPWSKNEKDSKEEAGNWTFSSGFKFNPPAESDCQEQPEHSRVHVTRSNAALKDSNKKDNISFFIPFPTIVSKLNAVSSL